jgi:CubicO group peptidase (beta-lactamase class C family)
MRKLEPFRHVCPFGALILVFSSACAPRVADWPNQPIEPASAPADTADEELAVRLDRLEQELERARVEHHVPGMAAALVKDGEVVWSKGFGHADVEGDVSVTPETLFAIGSTTKAFTATLVGIMIDEGRMSWDDPVVRHLPEFRLKVDAEGETQLTVRDLLCHRSGFPRMGLLWVAGALSREEVFARASLAEPTAALGSKFLYNNVAYTAAGEATARAAHTPWEELLRDRLLEPLGMHDTVISADPEATPHLARGYEWRDAEGTLRRVPKRDISVIAPAGAIDSNVLDMAKWVRLLLTHGEVDGRRLVSADAIDETWKSHIAIAPSVEYGLGWMLRTWRDKRVVEHGGNIDGFAAEVALMPDEGLGFVLLMNLSGTTLQGAAPEIVWNALLGELEESAAPDEDLRPYVGKYVADFGPFENARFTVTQSGGKLFVDVPGQSNFELRAPGDDGRRPFALTDTIAVSFEREADDVVVLRMHQSGLDYELPREGWMPAPELEIDELQAYVGTYRGEPFGDVPVLVRNNRLAVDVPKQMVYELHAPDDDGVWRFRVKRDIGVVFEKTGDRVSTMRLLQDGTEMVFERAAGARAAPVIDLPRIDRVRRGARAEAALGKVGALVGRGAVRLPQSGVEGKVTITAAADGRATTTLDLGELGQIEDVLLADVAWTKESYSLVDVHAGKYLDQARHGHPLALFADWSRWFSDVSVLGQVERDGRTLWRVRLGRGEAPPVEALIDSKTGDPVQARGVKLMRLGGGIPTTVRHSEFRSVHGIRLPHRIEIDDESTGRVVITIDRWERFTGDLETAFPSAPSEGF